jgi:hypothetical protein
LGFGNLGLGSGSLLLGLLDSLSVGLVDGLLLFDIEVLDAVVLKSESLSRANSSNKEHHGNTVFHFCLII